MKYSPSIDSRHNIDVLDGFPEVIAAVGKERFSQTLLTMLSRLCGAEHCALFRVDQKAFLPVAAVSYDLESVKHRLLSRYIADSFWQVDSFLMQTVQATQSEGFSLDWNSTSTTPERELREKIFRVARIGERIVLCGRIQEQTVGICLLRSDEQSGLASDDIRRLKDFSLILLSVIRKHIDVVHRCEPLRPLTSLSEIVTTLHATEASLTQREIEVCSRIIFGIPAATIASQLGIVENTVVTYRKRAYDRLSIACQRELLTWYLHQWAMVNQQRKLSMH